MCMIYKQVMSAHQQGLVLVALSSEDESALTKITKRIIAEIEPIRITEFTSVDRYKGVPRQDAVVLEDGSILLLEKKLVDEIDGVKVHMLFCLVNNTKRFIALEFRGYHYFPW